MKVLCVYCVALAISVPAIAQVVTFGADNYNGLGKSIAVAVNCPRSSGISVQGYLSKNRDGLAKQARPTVKGQDGLVLYVPAYWWYRLVQAGNQCEAKAMTAPLLRH